MLRRTCLEGRKQKRSSKPTGEGSLVSGKPREESCAQCSREVKEHEGCELLVGWINMKKCSDLVEIPSC